MALIPLDRAPRWLPALAIAGVSLTTTLASLPNQFSYDDIVIILQNPSVQRLDHPWEVFARPYWPRPFDPWLYRPLTTLSLATQWRIGGGAPWLFHAVSVLEYLSVCLAFYALARVVFAPLGAWAAAALFAAHPLHVEATAIGVNQGELLTALLLLIAVTVYVHQRAAGPLSARHQAMIVGLFLAACLTKEHGIVLPGLLVAAELTVVRDPRPWRLRVRELRPLMLALLLVAVVTLTVRSLVLGDVVGTFAAEAFRAASGEQRLLTMLGVVREWLRLMLWPAHLQTDYTPREIEAAAGWGGDQTVGAALLVATGALAWWCRRRRAVVTFGLLWVAVAIFPVSNVLVPTGVVLAERSLFLASVGMMLVVGSGIEWLAERLQYSILAARLVATAGLGGLVLTGAAFSAKRQAIWHDQRTLFSRMIQEAPLSYKAHWGYADLLFRAGERAAAERQYHLAIALYPYSWYLYTNFGDRYREAGFCDPAVKLYHRSLLLAPAAVGTRSSLMACLLYLGDYAAVKRQVKIGREVGKELNILARFQQTADSALAVRAPPHTVRITLPSEDGPNSAR